MMNSGRSMKGLSLSFLLLVMGCAQVASKTDHLPAPRTNEHLVASTVWFQNAAETRALQYMAFNLAKYRLQDELRRHRSGKRPSIVIDIDETVLDNSAYQAYSILNNQLFPHGWQEWVDKAKAAPIPGALEFLKFAHSKGVEIFYVTNRKTSEEKATQENLLALGFPFKKENLLVRVDTSSKKSRVERVAGHYKILLMIGDNLNDFSHVFEGKSISDRSQEVDRWRQEFGKKWIVLPNPMYGEWEGAVYGYEWQKSPEQKNLDRIKSLKTFGY